MEAQIDILQDEVKRLHEIREHCEKRFNKQSI
jgi:hypothetical protein